MAENPRCKLPLPVKRVKCRRIFPYRRNHLLMRGT